LEVTIDVPESEEPGSEAMRDVNLNQNKGSLKDKN